MPRTGTFGSISAMAVYGRKAPNGEIIAASQGYETKASAEKGIEAIKTHAPNAKVEDHTEAKSS